MDLLLEYLQDLFYDSETGLILTDLKTGTVEYFNRMASIIFSTHEIKEGEISSFLKNEIQIESKYPLIKNYQNKVLKIECNKIILKNINSIKNIKVAYKITDITSQQSRDTKLSILEAMSNSISDSIYAIDRNGNEIFYNNKIIRFESSNREKMLNGLKKVFDTGTPLVDQYKIFLNKDYQKVYMLTSVYPFIKNNEILAVYSVNKDITQLKNLLTKAIDLQIQPRNNHSNNTAKYRFDDIIGKSTALKSTIDKAKKSSLSNAPILLYGETGTGKELFAQSIHNYSSRAAEPFVPVNCGAIPDTLLENLLFGTVKGAFTGAENSVGLFEQTGKGTLFLDEINSLNVNLQVKLLRVLQEMSIRRLGDNKEKPVNCRIITSTNVDPQKLLESGKIREDFYYRISVIILTIPSLRERKEDIPLLCDYFLNRLKGLYNIAANSLSTEVLNSFLNYNWPGNIRELSGFLEGITTVIDDTVIDLKHLPNNFKSQTIQEEFETTYHDESVIENTPLPNKLKHIEQELILKALIENGNNVTKAAEALGIQRQNLQARMKKLNIEKALNFNI